jgi:hypothetical protein
MKLNAEGRSKLLIALDSCRDQMNLLRLST